MAQATQRLEGSEFAIAVLTKTLEGKNCIADSLPFKMWLPLNMSSLPA